MMDLIVYPDHVLYCRKAGKEKLFGMMNLIVYPDHVIYFRKAGKEKLSGMMDLIGYPDHVLNSTWLNQRFILSFF